MNKRRYFIPLCLLSLPFCLATCSQALDAQQLCSVETTSQPNGKPGSVPDPPTITHPQRLNAAVSEPKEDAVPAAGQTSLAVVQALNAALLRGPRAAAIRAQLCVVRAQYAAATQVPNPGFFFDRGIVAEQENRLGPLLTSEAPWKQIYRLIGTKRLVAQTKVDLLTQLWALRAEVRRAYVAVVLAQETQKNLEQLQALAERLLVVSSKRFEAGDVPELDVLKARLVTAQAAVDVGVGSKRIIRAKQQLNILIGHPVDAPLFVPALPDYTSTEPRFRLRAEKNDVLPDFNRDVGALDLFVNKALQSRLELQSLGLQLKVNEISKTGAELSALPNPSLAFGKSQAGNPPGGPKIQAVFMTYNQELPFTNVQQGSICQFGATETQLHYQIGAQRNQVIGEVSSAYNNLLAARDKLRVYQDRLLSDSNEVTRLAQRSYEAGRSDITSTLFAQQANVVTRANYLDAVNDYATAFTDLELAVGKPLQ